MQRWQSVILFQLQRAAAAANIDTLLAVHLRQRLRNFRAHRTHAQCWLLLIEGYGHAAFARRSGNLKANPAAADYRQFLTCRQTTFQTLRILPVTQGINLGMRRPRLVR